MVYGIHWIDLGALAIMALTTVCGMAVGFFRLLLMAFSWAGAGFLSWWILPHLRYMASGFTHDSPWGDVIAIIFAVPLGLGLGMFLWVVSWILFQRYAPRRRWRHRLGDGLGGFAAGYAICFCLYASAMILWSPADVTAWSAGAKLQPYLAAPGQWLAQNIWYAPFWHTPSLLNFKMFYSLLLGLLVCIPTTYVLYKHRDILDPLWPQLRALSAGLSRAGLCRRPQTHAPCQSEDIIAGSSESVETGFAPSPLKSREGIAATRARTVLKTLSNTPQVRGLNALSWKTAWLWARLFEGVLLSVLTTFIIVWAGLPDAEMTRQMARTVHIDLQKTTRPDGTAALKLTGSEFEYGFQTRLENISPHFLHATIASEDWRFYEHGVPYKTAKFIQAFLQCVWTLSQNLLQDEHQSCAGNSTITQQLARNLWIGEKRSVYRKIKELLWAIKMELALSKDEILTYYVNRIHLGQRNFGIEMASRAYFGKSPKALSLYEAAILAAAIKSPAWNWATSPQKAIERGNVILTSMKKRHYLPASIASIPPSFKPVVGDKSLSKPYLKHFYQWLESKIAAVLADEPDGQYKVITVLHAEAQLYAEKHLQQAVWHQQKQGVAVSQGAMLAMRPDGAVTVMVGGVGDSETARGMNRAKATEGLLPRPPASAFKPIIYLAALEHGLEPQSRIDARAIEIPMGLHQPPYAPRNHADKVYETVTLTQALVDSINTATVRLLYEQLSVDAVKALAQRLGIDPRWLKSEWGLALGSSGVPLIEMATAYSVFANGGYAVQPYGISAIYNAQGDLVWRHHSVRSKRIVEAPYIHELNTMLAEAARHGTERIATRGFRGDRMIAGKTGTGDAFVDAWFIGYTADLTTGVWLGNDVPQPMPDLYGGTAPARVWNTFMQDVVKLTTLHPVLHALP